MGDAKPKLNIFNLGSLGVNRVLSPIHKRDGELMQAQNALSGIQQGRDALRKRWGMTKYNGTVYPAAIKSIHGLPYAGFADPSTGSGSWTSASGFVLWPGFQQWFQAGPTYADTTASIALSNFSLPPFSTAQGVYQIFETQGGLGAHYLHSFDANTLTTSSRLSTMIDGMVGAWSSVDSTGPQYITYRVGIFGGWQAESIDPSGTRTAMGAEGDFDNLISPVQANQAAVCATADGTIVGILTYGIWQLTWGGSWSLGTDIQTTYASPLADYELLGTTLAVSRNRIFFSVYDNNQVRAGLGRLWKSDDYGATWSELRVGGVANGKLDIIYASLSNDWVIIAEQTSSAPITLYANEWKLYISYDNGDNFTLLATISGTDVSPYIYGSRLFGQTTGDYVGAWFDMETGEVFIYTVDDSANYTALVSVPANGYWSKYATPAVSFGAIFPPTP